MSSVECLGLAETFVLNPFDQQQLPWRLKHPNKVGVITPSFVSLRLGPKDFRFWLPEFKWGLMVIQRKKRRRKKEKLLKMSAIFSQLILLFNLIIGIITAAGGSAGFWATCRHANVLAITHTLSSGISKLLLPPESVCSFSICFSLCFVKREWCQENY